VSLLHDDDSNDDDNSDNSSKDKDTDDGDSGRSGGAPIVVGDFAFCLRGREASDIASCAECVVDLVAVKVVVEEVKGIKSRPGGGSDVCCVDVVLGNVQRNQGSQGLKRLRKNSVTVVRKTEESEGRKIAGLRERVEMVSVEDERFEGGDSTDSLWEVLKVICSKRKILELCCIKSLRNNRNGISGKLQDFERRHLSDYGRNSVHAAVGHIKSDEVLCLASVVWNREL